MHMEGADTSISQTRGKIEDLPLTVGGITYYVQAQVVRYSPTRILLGMPFRALANCHTDVYADGYTTLTISDLNNPSWVVTVPTRPKGTSKQKSALLLQAHPSRKTPELFSQMKVLASARPFF
jgi:hypothetical protein